jgi:hypothetical protein
MSLVVCNDRDHQIVNRSYGSENVLSEGDRQIAGIPARLGNRSFIGLFRIEEDSGPKGAEQSRAYDNGSRSETSEGSTCRQA